MLFRSDFGLGDRQLLTVGLDWLRDRVDSSTAYDETQRDNHAVFAQYQATFGAQSLEASARHDDNEQFGTHTTGSAAWGIAFAQDWRVTIGYGTAFKAPTFNELYFPSFGGFPTSNPNLVPEESKSWEAGVAHRGDRATWRLDGFSTRVDDLIVLDAMFVPQNLDSARLRGAELGVDTTFNDWTVAASASVLDTENRGNGANAGNRLPRRAQHSARIELDRAFGALRLGITGIGEGARFDDVGNTRRLGGYATFDLRAEYAFAPAWTVQVRAANVFDRDYETAAFYNQAGREFFLTLRYAPAN